MEKCNDISTVLKLFHSGTQVRPSIGSDNQENI